MATVELSVPALQETPISETSETHLKLFIEPTEEASDKVRMLIPDIGVATSGAQFAMDVTRHDGQLTFEYLTSPDGQIWNIKNTETIDILDEADVDTIIKGRRKRYYDCINWDATGI